MLFQELRPNYHALSSTEQLAFLANYSRKREQDLSTPPTISKKRTPGKKSTGRKIPVTIETLDLLKKMGLV